VMRLADRPPNGVVMHVFSRSYWSNGRVIGMVVVCRPSVTEEMWLNGKCGDGTVE